MTRPVNHEMLILARESRGLTQVDLARHAGLSQAELSRFENGAREPSAEQLERLADVLAYPASFFRRKGERYGIGSKGVFHRKRKSLSAKELDQLNAKIDLLRIMVSELMRSVEIEREHSFPSHDPEDFNDDIEQIAALVRAQWKLPRGPIKDLVGVIENAGGIVHFTDFGTPKLDAISQWIPSTPPVFLVNSEKPGDRVRFTLCHELGHVILHDQTMRELNEMEEQADKFASAFLMPEQDILPDFDQRLTLPRLAQLKSKWRVSMAALAKRAYDLEQITERQYRSIFEDLSKSGYRMREPINITVQRPSLIQEIIASHVTDLKYSINELAEALSLYEDELVREYLDQPDGPRLVFLPQKKPIAQKPGLANEPDNDADVTDLETTTKPSPVMDLTTKRKVFEVKRPGPDRTRGQQDTEK